MAEYKDLQNKRVENELSKLGALISIAEDDVLSAEASIFATKIKLQKIQQEIEQLYITLNDPFLTTNK